MYKYAPLSVTSWPCKHRAQSKLKCVFMNFLSLWEDRKGDISCSLLTCTPEIESKTVEERSWRSLSTWVELLRQSLKWSVSRKATLASALCFTMIEYFYETPSAWEQRYSSRVRRTQQNQDELCYFGMKSKAFLLAWSLLSHSFQPGVDFLLTWCAPLLLGPNGSLGRVWEGVVSMA